MSDYLWIVGAALSIVGSIFSNLGVNVQKYSQNKEAERPKDKQRVYYKQGLWVVGIVLVVLGSLGDFWALSMAAQSIVAPIGSITLVTNVLFARFGLKEELTRMDIIGTALVIIGSVTSVAFGNHESKEYTLDELKKLYQATGFIVYIVLMVIVLVLMYIAAKRLEPMKSELVEYARRFERTLDRDFQQDNEDADIEQPVRSDSDEDLDNERLLLLQSKDHIRDLSEKYKPFEKIHPFLLCALSGVFGAQSVLFAKTNAEMMDVSFRGNNQYDQFLPYLFLPAMLFFIFSQLHWMAVALKNFDALYVVPVFQCFFIIVSTLGGAVFFQEFASFSVLQAIMFPIGVIITLIGVWILSQRDMTEAADEWNLVDQEDDKDDVAKTLDFDIQTQDSMSSFSLASAASLSESRSVSRSVSRSRNLSVFFPNALKMSEAVMNAKRHQDSGADHSASDAEDTHRDDSDQDIITPSQPKLKSSSIMASVDARNDDVRDMKSPSHDAATLAASRRRQGTSSTEKKRPMLKKSMTAKTRGEQLIRGNSPATRHARRISKFGVDDVKRELQESYKSIRRVSRVSRGSISVPFASLIGSVHDITSKQAGHEPKKGRVSRRRASTMIRSGSLRNNQATRIRATSALPTPSSSSTNQPEAGQANVHTATATLSRRDLSNASNDAAIVSAPSSTASSLSLQPVQESATAPVSETDVEVTLDVKENKEAEDQSQVEDPKKQPPQSMSQPETDLDTRKNKSKRMVQQRALVDQQNVDKEYEREVPDEFPTNTIKELFQDEVLGDRVARMKDQFGHSSHDAAPQREDSQAELLSNQNKSS